MGKALAGNEVRIHNHPQSLVILPLPGLELTEELSPRRPCRLVMSGEKYFATRQPDFDGECL